MFTRLLSLASERLQSQISHWRPFETPRSEAFSWSIAPIVKTPRGFARVKVPCPYIRSSIYTLEVPCPFARTFLHGPNLLCPFARALCKLHALRSPPCPFAHFAPFFARVPCPFARSVFAGSLPVTCPVPLHTFRSSLSLCTLRLPVPLQVSSGGAGNLRFFVAIAIDAVVRYGPRSIHAGRASDRNHPCRC